MNSVVISQCRVRRSEAPAAKIGACWHRIGVRGMKFKLKAMFVQTLGKGGRIGVRGAGRAGCGLRRRAVSNTDSFIEEVSEAVRRDRLYALMRRYSGLAVALVALIVGGAAYNEWRKAETLARAQAFGDSVLAALEGDEGQDRIEALAGIEPAVDGDALMVLRFIDAAERLGADDAPGAAEVYGRIADDADAPGIYRDLAALKRVVILGAELPAEERRQILDGMAAPGAPFRLLAEEQMALIDIEAGEAGAAIERLRAIIADAEVTPGLRSRANGLITALGAEQDAG